MCKNWQWSEKHNKEASAVLVFDGISIRGGGGEGCGDKGGWRHPQIHCSNTSILPAFNQFLMEKIMRRQYGCPKPPFQTITFLQASTTDDGLTTHLS